MSRAETLHRSGSGDARAQDEHREHGYRGLVGEPRDTLLWRDPGPRVEHDEREHDDERRHVDGDSFGHEHHEREDGHREDDEHIHRERGHALADMRDQKRHR